MKSFFSDFNNSAAELKNVRCLTVTGILTAAFIVLDMFSFRPTEFIKVNFAFIALAAVGMLYGPVPAMLSAAAGDLVGCILSGQAPLPLLSTTAVLTGLVYGTLLYKKEGFKLVVFSVIARLADSFLICLLLNTPILMYYGFMSSAPQQLYLRFGKTAAELIFFIPLTITVLPAVKAVYGRTVNHKSI
ncbi:MAG: folate family ECF transporter S component [Oscillospiraceae bacterium]|nr:folate family ECF transporter S component [Oscillospiraceae bacterium]